VKLYQKYDGAVLIPTSKSTSVLCMLPKNTNGGGRDQPANWPSLACSSSDGPVRLSNQAMARSYHLLDYG